MGRVFTTEIPRPTGRIVKIDEEGFQEFINYGIEEKGGFKEHRTDFLFQNVELFPDITNQAYTEKDLKRAPTEAEKSAMEKVLKSFSELFKNLPIKWSLEGGIVFSLLCGEFRRRHKDWDIGIEEIDLKILEDYLAQKGYGLFIRHKAKLGDRGRVMEKIDYSAAIGKEVAGELIIAAINSDGQIIETANPNFIDITIIERDKETGLPVNNGVSLPEEWFMSSRINFKGCEINVANPLKAIYYKIHLNRPYDIADLLSLAETGQIALPDLAQVRGILIKESALKEQKISEFADRVACQVNDKSSRRDINLILQNDPLISGNKSIEINRLLKAIAKDIKNSPEKSSQAILQIITQHYDVTISLQKQFETIRRMEDVIKIRAIKDKISDSPALSKL